MTARVLAIVLLMAPVAARAADPNFVTTLQDATLRYPAADARSTVADAFLHFESSQLHVDVASRDPALYRELEASWLALAAMMRQGAPPVDVRAQGTRVVDLLERAAGRTPGAGPSSLFVDAWLIIVREGFEAILILTALAAYLVKVGQRDKRRILYAGAGAAVLATLALAVVAERVVPVSGAAREALEGATMLLAVVVLFTASYWLISKAEARRWQSFVRARVEGALGSERRVALALLAFLVVFREGFETVLFYQALGARAAGTAVGVSAVASGFALGVAVLAVIAVALFRYGVRIPIGPFFAVTGALLYLLAFKFAGAGVRELQEGGFLPVTPVAIPDVALLRDWFAVSPFLEPLLAQALMLAALIAGAVYVALTRPRTSVGGVEARS